MSFDGFVGREIELGGIVVGKAGPRGVVASFDEHQSSWFDGESGIRMGIVDKGFNAG